jgi:hypothetical protein
MASLKFSTYEALVAWDEFFAEADQMPALVRELIAKIPDAVLLPFAREAKEKFAAEKILSAKTRAEIAARLVKKILIKPLELIRRAKENYQFSLDFVTSLGLACLKGPAFVLYGANAGICTGENVALWSKLEYLIFPILGAENEAPDFQGRTNLITNGCVQAYLHNTADKSHFVALAFDPSLELLSVVDADALFAELLRSTCALAARLGHKSIFIPVNKWVRSNRSDINKAIESFAKVHGLKVIKLAPLCWLGGEGENAVMTEFFEVRVDF